MFKSEDVNTRSIVSKSAISKKFICPGCAGKIVRSSITSAIFSPPEGFRQIFYCPKCGRYVCDTCYTGYFMAECPGCRSKLINQLIAARVEYEMD